MRSKRRKPRVVWLPIDVENRLGQAPSPATSGINSSTGIKIYTVNPLGTTGITEEIAVVKDFSGINQVATQATSLADLEQSGYRLRRIVGKLVFQMLQGAAVAAGDVNIAIVTAGFIIRRIDQQDLTGRSLAAVLGGTGDELSVANLDNIADPWIWRRSWVLADVVNSTAVDVNATAFPLSNTQYGGGVLDGPHIDAKVARVVGPEERLFFCVTTEGINGQPQGNPGAVLLLSDLRVLASMRNQVGNRRNASR